MLRCSFSTPLITYICNFHTNFATSWNNRDVERYQRNIAHFCSVATPNHSCTRFRVEILLVFLTSSMVSDSKLNAVGALEVNFRNFLQLKTCKHGKTAKKNWKFMKQRISLTLSNRFLFKRLFQGKKRKCMNFPDYCPIFSKMASTFCKSLVNFWKYNFIVRKLFFGRLIKSVKYLFLNIIMLTGGLWYLYYVILR